MKTQVIIKITSPWFWPTLPS